MCMPMASAVVMPMTEAKRLPLRRQTEPLLYLGQPGTLKGPFGRPGLERTRGRALFQRWKQELGNGLELVDDGHRGCGGFVRSRAQAVIDMIVDQRALRLADGFLNG